MDYIIDHFETVDDPAEMVALIPCPKVADQPDDRRVIYELDLGEGIRPGQTLDCSFQFETTNELAKYHTDPAKKSWANVEVCWGIIISETSSVGTSAKGDRVGREINQQLGTNVTPGQHHGVHAGGRKRKVPALYVDYPNFRYLKLIVWSQSSLSVTAFPGVYIMQGYGHLDCMRWTPIPV